MQNRPEFHRRVLSASWRYKWHFHGRHNRYQVDLLDLNYVFMPWISDTFRREFLENENSRNTILRYNYEDLFITKTGFSYSYSHNNIALKWGIETSGNLLSLASKTFGNSKDDEGHYRLFNIAFAQYVKGDFDLTHSFDFDATNQLVLHLGLGLAYPYGNSSILPFEKRYFSGGANSVRGWSVRSLGPGRFKESDGRINFISQTGDMKLDLNAEYRTHLFWKLDYALFVDAGNIWTLREYRDQPGGQFKLNTFVEDLAVGYGMGFRFNFDYFILRFDLGMKAINPAYSTDNDEHYPLLQPRLSRDMAFHFAVGLPF
jgi:outer membrane protein assembly factor BamA